jgi:tetratricopeptide (TPR) repeat protein
MYYRAMRTIGLVCIVTGAALGQTLFWPPSNPPRVQYTADLRYVEETGRLEGRETIRFTNNTKRPIGRLNIRWSGDPLTVRQGGEECPRVSGQSAGRLFNLAKAAMPGERVELTIEFGANWRPNAKTASSYATPLLWWGFGTHDDYDVKIDVPAGFAFASSGRLNAATGRYVAQGVRAFGLFLAKGYEMAEADAGDVKVRALFTAKGRPCAELLLKSAVDAIGFYRQEFGLYPHKSLSIVPGSDYPAGGYPAASALVVVHGQERMSERPEGWWRWITAHEIGHEYWSEHVMADGTDSLSWLMIGLGIYADREYRRARGIGEGVGESQERYVRGVREGLDTTMDLTDEQERAVKFDFNNVVFHGKSAAMVNALESVMGKEAFRRVYVKALKEYSGKRLGWREFQRLCEVETGEDLGWFFGQWARSSRAAMFKVTGTDCTQSAGGFDCRVKVERTGSMRMPVTVAVRFEDGTEQRARTEWMLDVNEMRFQAKSKLKESVLEPDGAVAMAEAPGAEEQALRDKLREMPWTGAGAAALDLYKQALKTEPKEGSVWTKLSLTLYDGRYYEEALDALARLERADPAERFLAHVWRGHIYDLQGKRAQALTQYQEALMEQGARAARHDQYQMTIDRAWVEARLKTPFERKQALP